MTRYNHSMLAVTKSQAYGLVLLIALLGILAIIIVCLLMVSWRRYNRRLANKPRHQPMPDIWQASGDRLMSKMHPPFPKHENHDENDDDQSKSGDTGPIDPHDDES